VVVAAVVAVVGGSVAVEVAEVDFWPDWVAPHAARVKAPTTARIKVPIRGQRASGDLGIYWPESQWHRLVILLPRYLYRHLQ